MNKDAITPPPLPRQKDKHTRYFWVSTVVVVSSCLVFLILLLFVVPVFAGMFADFGSELPKPTQILIDASEFMKSYFFVMQFPIVGLVAWIIWGLGELDKQGKKAIVLLIGLVPIVMLMILIFAMFLPIYQLGIVVVE